MPTILITGCSSGFGLETAKLFLERSWDVIATMRTPTEDLLPASVRLRVLALDVTDSTSIERAVEAAGHIDVLVNNAGFGAPSPVELTAPETVQALFQTNTIGTLAMVQAVAPQMRRRRAGIIINVTSTVTIKTLPVVGVYRASKAAVNAFSESLAVEMQPFDVRVHIVLPGRSPETSFWRQCPSASAWHGRSGLCTAAPAIREECAGRHRSRDPCIRRGGGGLARCHGPNCPATYSRWCRRGALDGRGRFVTGTAITEAVTPLSLQ